MACSTKHGPSPERLQSTDFVLLLLEKRQTFVLEQHPVSESIGVGVQEFDHAQMTLCNKCNSSGVFSNALGAGARRHLSSQILAYHQAYALDGSPGWIAAVFKARRSASSLLGTVFLKGCRELSLGLRTSIGMYLSLYVHIRLQLQLK